MAVRVREELERGQLYDGEKFDRLVALGAEAVPALCENLETYEFPAVIMNVLAEFRDARAVPALLVLLEKTRKGWSDSWHDAYFPVRALKEIGDPRAEKLLLEIASSESAHVALRFHATTALARLGSPEVKQRAWDEIMRIHRTGERVSSTAWPDPNVIIDDDVSLALCEVSTEEADEALARLIRARWPGYRQARVIEVLGRRTETRNRKKVVDALVYAAEHEDGGYFMVQFNAVMALYALDGVVPDERLREIVASLEEAYPHLTEPVAKKSHFSEKTQAPFLRVKQELAARVAAEKESSGPTGEAEAGNEVSGLGDAN